VSGPPRFLFRQGRATIADGVIVSALALALALLDDGCVLRNPGGQVMALDCSSSRRGGHCDGVRVLNVNA
jgi:hypothetical protein